MPGVPGLWRTAKSLRSLLHLIIRRIEHALGNRNNSCRDTITTQIARVDGALGRAETRLLHPSILRRAGQESRRTKDHTLTQTLGVLFVVILSFSIGLQTEAVYSLTNSVRLGRSTLAQIIPAFRFLDSMARYDQRRLGSRQAGTRSALPRWIARGSGPF